MAVRSKDINKELQSIDDMAEIKEGDSQETKLLKANLKATGLLVKLFRDFRNNQVLFERAKGNDIVKMQRLFTDSDGEKVE